MEVKRIQEEGLKWVVEISSPFIEFQEKYEKELAAQQSTYNVKGFRPGKVPVQQTQSMLGPKIRSEVINNIIYESSHDFLKKNNLQPIVEPEIKINTSPDNEQDLNYTLYFEVAPIVPLVKPEELSVTKYLFNINSEDVDKYTEQIMEKAFDYVDTADDYKAQEGDKITLDFEGKINGRAFKGGSAKDFQIILGQNKILADLEQALIGVTKGIQKHVTANFPNDYHDSALQNKTAVFAIVIKNIYARTKLSKEELITKLKFKDETEFKLNIEKKLAQECQEIAKSYSKKELIAKLLDYYQEMKVPDALIEQESKYLSNLQNSVVERNDKIADRVRLGLLFNKFRAYHKIDISPEEVNSRLVNTLNLYSGGNPQYRDYLLKLYSKDINLLTKLSSEIMEEKIFNELLNQVNKVEKTITVNELLNKENYAHELSTDSNRSN